LASWPANADLIEAGCSGAGSLLVRRRVFNRIRTELKENPFDILPPWSEDFSFFRRLHKIGIKMHCCPAIESYHLTVRSITSADRDLTGLSLQTTKPEEAASAIQ
jgi:GT2 family glycosyltransferase